MPQKQFVNQPSPLPTTKILAATGGGALGVFVVWLFAQFGIEMSMEAANGLIVLLSALAGYVMPERRVVDAPTLPEPAESKDEAQAPE